MPLWSFFLIVAGSLIAIGVGIDFIVKKKNLRLDPEEGIKNASESEQVYKELHLKQTIDDFNTPKQ
ncbi:hypothetical protein [Cytobacillus praedii]|uniref:Uncharacterized protein n=1 Tax=Cytobacillus praedii TaxID=1742358 RepID=A0A4R1ARN0_9BACI|nr:hypothetical protein [Cytobacillus praedii]TCJ00462.1 hypothetical protein E0Y62_26740 [Cytobacillus praedii]